MAIERRKETVVVSGGTPLRIDFSPQAIREHFEGSDCRAAIAVRNMSDDELAEVAEEAIWDEPLWQAFHEALSEAAFRHSA